MVASAESCPVCRSPRRLSLVRLADVPVHQNLPAATAEAARDCPRGTIDLRICEDCTFVWNAAFDAGLLCYSADYDNTQDHSAVFRDYRAALAARLAERFALRGKTVVEVGCGKGAFLADLAQHGIAAAVGFDPSYVGPEQRGCVRFVRDFFGPRHGTAAADFVCCRHVIEHVARPVDFLRTIDAAGAIDASAARRPAHFFETPDVAWILQHGAIWDVFYEHCSLFSALSARRAFAEAGLGEVEVTTAFGGQYLWIETPFGRPAVDAALRDEAERSTILSDAVRFAQAFPRALERLAEQLAALSRSGPCAVWGAGAKGVTLLNLLRAGPDRVRAVVDVNPAKRGRFVTGTGLPIVGPEDMAALGIRTVWVMNPNYADEIRRRLAGLKLSMRVEVLT